MPARAPTVTITPHNGGSAITKSVNNNRPTTNQGGIGIPKNEIPPSKLRPPVNKMPPIKPPSDSGYIGIPTGAPLTTVPGSPNFDPNPQNQPQSSDYQTDFNLNRPVSRPNVAETQASRVQSQSPTNYQGYDADQSSPASDIGYQGYDAEKVGDGVGNYDASQGQMADGDSVENRLTGMLSRDSEYMRRAGYKADEMTNKRGMLNSSINIGASQAAAIDAAMPIAQQDAQTSTQFNLANLGYLNESNRLNAGANLAREDINASAENRAREVNAASDLKADTFNTEMDVQQSQFDAGQVNDAAKTNALAQQATDQFNSGMLSEDSRLNAQIDNQTNRDNANAQNAANTAQAAEENKRQFELMNAEIKEELGRLDNSLKQDLINIEQQWMSDRNMDSVNGAIYQDMQRDIGAIIKDTDDADVARAKVQNYLASINATFQFANGEGGAGSNGDLPDFETGETNENPPPPSSGQTGNAGNNGVGGESDGSGESNGPGGDGGDGDGDGADDGNNGDDSEDGDGEE